MRFSKGLPKFLLGIFISGYLCASFAFAETKSDPISARAEINKGSVTIGEPIECKLIIRHTKDVEILSNLNNPEIRGFDIKKSQDWQDKEGNFQIVGKTITFTSYQLGSYLIEPIEVSYRVKAGAVQTIRTNPLYISVKSVAAGEEKKDIRDVKGVVKLDYEWLKYALPVGIPLLILALLAIYFLYYRPRQNSLGSTKTKLTPAAAALRDLHELFDSSWIREGRVKHYYLRFSEVLKIFLENQFGIPASEATTSEIAFLLKRLALSDESKKRLIEVLEAADFAKFAKWVPAPADIIALNKQAEAVIQELSSAQTTENHAVS